jgi:H+/Cl- antiporter ClcA
MLDFKSEEAVMRQLIEEYKVVAEKGPEGDVPIPEGFGSRPVFWKVVIIASLIGMFLGVAAVGILNCATEIPKIWIDNGNFDELNDFDYYAGDKFWIVITTTTGILVGLIRWGTNYPDNLAGFFKEVNNCHVDPTHVPVTVAVSALSLAGGGCLGPEACLGNLGGGLGTWVSERVGIVEENDRKLLVLSTMTAALGSLFPTPFQAVLMVIESCAVLPRPFMESTAAGAFPAIVSFAVFYTLSDIAYLKHLEPQYGLSENWEFELVHVFYGLIIGIISGCLCLVQLLAVGICKQLFIRLRTRCDATGFLSGTIIAPGVGGLIIGKSNLKIVLPLQYTIITSLFLSTKGLLYWTLPMTIGDGNLVSAPIIGHTIKSDLTGTPDINQTLLIQSAFGKMLALAISLNCGMIGGFVFPMLTIGVMSATVCHQRYPDIPYLLFISCFMSGIPSGICPMPITMLRYWIGFSPLSYFLHHIFLT